MKNDVPYQLLITIPLLIIGIPFIVARMTGWTRLAERFASESSVDGPVFRAASLQLKAGLFPGKYTNAVRIIVGADSIALMPIWILKFSHSRLVIPWSAIGDCKPEKMLWWRFTRLTFGDGRFSMLLRGRVGQALEQRWNELHPGSTLFN